MAAGPTWQPVVGGIIGSDVTCGACIIDEQRVEDQRFRPVQDMWVVGMCGMWAAYIAYAVEGAGGVLDCVAWWKRVYLFILWKGGEDRGRQDYDFIGGKGL